VPLFLFVSGYGLVMKYERSGRPKRVSVLQKTDGEPWPAVPFLRRHYTKLLWLLLTGYALFMILSVVRNGDFRGFTPHTVIAQLLMYINLFPEPEKVIKPGPYWFFSLMMQMYIIFRIVLYKRSNTICLALIAACTLLQMLCQPEGAVLNWLRYNCVGSMLPFGTGVIFARLCNTSEVPEPKKEQVKYILNAIISILLICLSAIYYYSWFFTPLFIITATIAIVRMLRGPLLKAAAWTGSVSAFLFVAHPITREMTVWQYSRYHQYQGLLLYLLASFALAMLMKFIYDALGKLFKDKNNGQGYNGEYDRNDDLDGGYGGYANENINLTDDSGR